MSVLSSVLEQIRGKRREKQQTIQEQYMTLLDQLAKGQEVDVDALAEVLDALDKSDADLQADIDAKQRRFQDAQRHAEYLRLRNDAPAVQAELDAANAAMRAAIAKVQPRVTAAAEAWEKSVMRQSQIDNSENRLLQTVLNPILIARRTELTREQRELHESARPVREDINKLGQLLVSYRGTLEQTIDQLAVRGIARDHRSVLSDPRVLGAQRQIEAAEEALAELHERLEPFTAQLAMIEQEFAELRAAELIP